MQGDAESAESRAILDLLKQSLSNHPETRQLTGADIQVEEFANVGFSANEVRKVFIDWDTAAPGVPSKLIAKKWEPGSWTSHETNAVCSRETRGFTDGILTEEKMPGDFRAPFLGAVSNHSGDWVLMEDVEAELALFRTPKARDHNSRVMLEKLAKFHVYWEDHTRLPKRSQAPWLYWQDDRLQQFSSSCSVGIGGDACYALDERAKRYFSEEPRGVRVWAGFIDGFFDLVPACDHSLWKHYLCNRDEVVQWGRMYPQTMVHGDLHVNNIGMRRSDSGEEILAIDWEWLGIGTHAIDVVYYLKTSVFEPGIDVGELMTHYFESYVSCGGRAMSRKVWDDALDLAVVYLGLCFLAPHVPQVFQSLGEKKATQWYQAEIAQTTRLLRDKLG